MMAETGQHLGVTEGSDPRPLPMLKASAVGLAQAGSVCSHHMCHSRVAAVLRDVDGDPGESSEAGQGLDGLIQVARPVQGLAVSAPGLENTHDLSQC